MSKVDFSKLRILLVDDEAYTRSIIRGLLLQLGIRTLGECANGKDGLMELVRTRPDIVFCDVHMAPMNGKQFLQGVRQIRVRGLDRTHVVFLTGDAGADTVMFAKEYGVDGYLVKPVSLAQIRQRIEIVLAGDADLCAEISQRP